MRPRTPCVFVVAAWIVALAPRAPAQQEPAAAESSRATGADWLSWRGPRQNGTSSEHGLPEHVDPEANAPSWSLALSGRGTPVVRGRRLFAMAYRGERERLQELLVCLDTRTGERLWEHPFTDFLTDIIYTRYAIGSPTVDPETGNVYCLSSAGLLSCFTAAGRLVWQHSMMSEYGRMTFPNGRTGAPLVDGGLVIVHGITAAWGAHAPARDRFYAFDKHTGQPVWSSTPGGPPKDSSFSFPVVDFEHGRRVLYAGLGGGYLACVDVATGDPVWRFRMATGGVNSSPLLFGDTVVAVHGKENVDDSTIGRMVAVRRGARPAAPGKPAELGKRHEVWRAHLTAFTSSPVLVGERVYLTDHTGELACVDVRSGKVLWKKKLAPDQIHASPAYGDGKLYVPMTNGSFWVLRPAEEGPEVLDRAQLEGTCLGAPAIAHGRVFVHTTARLYSFAGSAAEPPPPTATPARLQVVPADFVARQGERTPLRVRGLDDRGRVVAERLAGVVFEGLPQGVSVRDDRLLVAADAPPAAVTVTARKGELVAAMRLRVVPAAPFALDFEDAALRRDPEGGAATAPPPRWWVGAGRKWEVRALEGGGKVLAKTLANPLFQRAMSFLGHPSTAGCTVQADLMSEGNRRIMSSAGVVNQRYLIQLKGNHQQLEVSSNQELLKKSVRFRWRPGVWYRLKTRVDLEKDGTAVVRAKAWKRDTPEPAAWTLEVRHPHGHTHGAPGIFGFAPQSRFRVYIDNFSVTPNG